VAESTVVLAAGFSQQAESIRSKAKALAEIRRVLDQDRLEILEILSQLMNSEPPEGIQAFFKRFELAESLAAKVASLSRTSAEIYGRRTKVAEVVTRRTFIPGLATVWR
jgi:hypothetical protein